VAVLAREAADHPKEGCGLKRRPQVAVPGSHRLDANVHQSGDDEDGQARLAYTQRESELDAPAIRHDLVRHEQIERLGYDSGLCNSRVEGSNDAPTLVLEGPGDEEPATRILIDDEGKRTSVEVLGCWLPEHMPYEAQWFAATSFLGKPNCGHGERLVESPGQLLGRRVRQARQLIVGKPRESMVTGWVTRQDHSAKTGRRHDETFVRQFVPRDKHRLTIEPPGRQLGSGQTTSRFPAKNSQIGINGLRNERSQADRGDPECPIAKVDCLGSSLSRRR
jgi:hypothetical protein